MNLEKITRRIKKLEKQIQERAGAHSRSDPRCICFPRGMVPMVGFPILESIAFLVKCPLHGDRFEPKKFWLYVSKWTRDMQYRLVLNRAPLLHQQFAPFPEKYRTAYLASFPPDLWPGQEEQEQADFGPKIFLRLKDGTRVQVSKQHFYRRFADVPEASQEASQKDRKEDESGDWIWEEQTLQIVGCLLSARGLMVDPRFCGKDE